MAVIQHKIRFIGDYREITKQLERASKALDKSLPGLRAFREESEKIDAAWKSIAVSMKAASTSARKAGRGGGGGGGGGRRRGGGGGGSGGGGGGDAGGDTVEDLMYGWTPSGWSGRGTKGPLDKMIGTARKAYTPTPPKAARAPREGGMGVGSIAAGVIGGNIATAGLFAAGRKIGGGAANIIGEADRATNSPVFSVQEYGRLSVAAQAGETDVQTLEKSVAKLNAEMSKAKIAPEFNRGLRALGVDVKTLRGLKPEAQLGLIADRLSDFKDPALQAAAAEKLFGERGGELLPFFRQGSAGIKKLGDEAERAGLVMTDETANAAAALNDNLEALERRAKGLATRIITSTFPTLNALLDTSEQIFSAASPGITMVLEALGQGLTEAVIYLKDAFAALQPVVMPLISGLATGFGPILTTVFDTLSGVVDTVVGAFEAFLGQLGVTSENAESVGAALADGLASAFAWVSETALILFSYLEPVASILGSILDLVWNVVTAGGNLTGVFGAIGQAVADLTQGALLTLQNLLAYIAELFDLFGSGEWIPGFRRLGEGLLDFILEPLRNIVASVISIADAISDDLVPDSVRAFANNTKVREFTQAHEAEQEQKREHKRLALADIEQKKRESGTKAVAKEEKQVSAQRMAALKQEGRTLSGPGLIDLGARDAKGRDIKVFVGNKARTDIAQALLRQASGGGSHAGGLASRALDTSPALAGARAGYAPLPAAGAAPMMRGPASVSIGAITIKIEGGTAMEWPELEFKLKRYVREEIADQVLEAATEANPGNLIM